MFFLLMVTTMISKIMVNGEDVLRVLRNQRFVKTF